MYCKHPHQQLYVTTKIVRHCQLQGASDTIILTIKSFHQQLYKDSDRALTAGVRGMEDVFWLFCICLIQRYTAVLWGRVSDVFVFVTNTNTEILSWCDGCDSVKGTQQLFCDCICIR